MDETMNVFPVKCENTQGIFMYGLLILNPTFDDIDHMIANGWRPNATRATFTWGLKNVVQFFADTRAVALDAFPPTTWEEAPNMIDPGSGQMAAERPHGMTDDEWAQVVEATSVDQAAVGGMLLATDDFVATYKSSATASIAKHLDEWIAAGGLTRK